MNRINPNDIENINTKKKTSVSLIKNIPAKQRKKDQAE